MTSQFDPDIAIVAAMEADEQLFTTRVESAPDDEVAIEVDDHDLCGTPPIHPKELSSGKRQPQANKDNPLHRSGLTNLLSLGSPPQTLPPSAARSLIDVPDDIAQIRGQIFEGKECVAFSAEQWEKYWPFFNNMYTKSGKPRVGKDGITKQYLACRLFASKTKVAKATTGERNKRARNPIACPKTARKITLPDGQVRFEPVDPTISHNHDLDTIDSISRPQIFKTAAGQEIAKGYAPAAVLSSICGHGGQQEGIQASIAMAGGTWLSRQDVLNAGRHCRKANPDSRQVGHDFLPTTQVEEVQQFLSAKSATGQLWLHKALKATRSLDGEDSPGVIFTSAEQLAALQRRGHITLLDATHNTNWLGWLLYTVMARDECGSWLPVGHFLTAKSDGDVVAAALKQLRLWIAQHCGQEWMLRYFLTDDSAVEQRAVKIAFDGSGQSVEHLLCSVHCERTLRRRFQGPRNRVVLDHMLAALKNRRTRVGCQASLDSAIAAVASQADAQYIVDHWQNRMEMWAHFARDHSPLLMQVRYPTLSPLPFLVITQRNRFGVSGSLCRTAFVVLCQSLIVHISEQCHISVKMGSMAQLGFSYCVLICVFCFVDWVYKCDQRLPLRPQIQQQVHSTAVFTPGHRQAYHYC